MGGGPGGDGTGVDTGSLFWAVVMSAFAGTFVYIDYHGQSLAIFFFDSIRWYPIRVSHINIFIVQLNWPINDRYDTGTIGGVIAMTDWLEVFGKVNPAPLAGQSPLYLPTNDKSLVVCNCLFIALDLF